VLCQSNLNWTFIAFFFHFFRAMYRRK